MASLTFALPKLSSSLKITSTKPKNHVPTKLFNLPCQKRGSRLAIRCLATDTDTDIIRSDFPTTFKFGASSSAIQTEGPGTEGGRGPSTWDHFIDAANGGMGADSYNKYKEDVQLLKNMNVDVYRFSIAWPRILPEGTVSGGINQDGIDFYNNLIDELIANGLEPFVTLFHFDLPSALQTSYNGFLSSQFVDDYKSFAEICFKNFGDRVKFWATFNEPQVFAEYGYQTALPVTNEPTTMPYIAAHNTILAHAAAAALYKETYQATQGGKIGISLSCLWYEPYTSSPADKNAARRAWDFHLGWYFEPLVTGDYPFSMKSIVRDRLPVFTDEEKESVKGSYDFVTINYYTARYAKGLTISANDVSTGYTFDQYVETLVEKDGTTIGPAAEGSDQIYIYPQGLAAALLDLKVTYENPLIYITENGCPQEPGDDVPVETVLNDTERLEFVKGHLGAVKEALSAGVDVNGYFVWSLLDCMEWAVGYAVRMGLNYTDYNNDFERSPKSSATWLKTFLSDTTTTDSTSNTTATATATVST